MRIVGVGTDIVDVRRIAAVHARFGARFAQRILGPGEQGAFESCADPAAFLAKRFAAKEAVGKALGCGMRGGALWRRIEVGHTAAGRPRARLAAGLAPGIDVHLSVADERCYATATALAVRP